MKRACEVAKAKINEVKVIHNDDGNDYNGAKFETVDEFRVLFRYAFFLDAYLDLVELSANFYFCGPSEFEYYYYLVTGRSEDISYARREKTRFGIPKFPKFSLDRLRCHYGIWNEEAEEYFAQWDRLFADVENFIGGGNVQDK